jgi:hypothetical protein
MRLVNPGIFRKNYVACDIHTKDWKVTRRETDFYSLKSILSKFYPGSIIPLLPKALLTQFDSSSLVKRKEYSQSFLNELLDHPLLSTSKILACFLSCSEEQFKAVKNELESLPPPKSISECYTVSGSAQIYLDKTLSEQCTNLHSNCLKECFKR